MTVKQSNSYLEFDERRYAAVPFWFWNGKQNKAQITSQLEKAAAGGLRGMAIHARVGNQTEYMSEEWLDLYRHACAEAKRLGLEIWLYDDEDFPSGLVGHRLPRKGAEYCQRSLEFTCCTLSEAAAIDDVVRVFRKDDPSVMISDFSTCDPHTQVLVFYRFIKVDDQVDYLCRKTCEEFMNMTHRKYLEALPEYIGKVITTVYTDDLQHLVGWGNSLSYTDDMEEIFQQEYGYSLLDHVSALIENVPGCEKVRFDYRLLLCKLFHERFVEPIYDWCHRHQMKFTGHLCGDEGPFYLMLRSFTEPMAFYEWEDIPGIDDFLCGNSSNRYMDEAINRFPKDFNRAKGLSLSVLCKQAASVASQLKKGLCSSEVLTSLGWGVPVENQMAQLKFEIALGVNIIVPHDYSYGTAAVAKRDHPASFFFQQPYYFQNKNLYDPLCRTMQLMSRGRVWASALVIHPMTSLWVASDGVDIAGPGEYTAAQNTTYPGSREYDEQMEKLNLHLLRQHISFEYGSEILIRRHGSVQNRDFVIGDAGYQTVILPHLINISSALKTLLDEFAANGGKIIVLGCSPFMVNGEIQDPIHFCGEIFLDDCTAISPALIPADLSFHTDNAAADPQILVSVRLVDGRKEYYLVNYADDSRTLTLDDFPFEKYDLWDPVSAKRLTGEQGNMPHSFRMNRFESLHLLPAGVIDPAETVPIHESRFAVLEQDCKQALDANWQIHLPQNNILLLDTVWNQKDRLIYINAPEDAEQIQPGQEYRVIFDLPDNAPDAVFYYEKNSMKLKSINGICAGTLEEVAHHAASQDLAGIAVGRILKAGKNELALEASGLRLESMYISVPFAVTLSQEHPECVQVLPFDKQPDFGNLVLQGYPFYHGVVEYCAEFDWQGIGKHVILQWKQFGSGAVTLNINGQDLICRENSVAEWNISRELKPGKNQIKLTVSNTAQNLMGPHRNSALTGQCLTAICPPPVFPGCNGSFDFGLASFGLTEKPCFIVW